LLPVLLIFLCQSSNADAATLTAFSVTPADPSANSAVATTYSLAFSGTSGTAAKCIRLRFEGDDATLPAPSNSAWQFQGGSTTDGSAVTLTTASQSFTGSIGAYRVPLPSEGFHATFDGYIGGGGGADGMTFTFLDGYAYGGYAGADGGGLGYSGLNGVAVTMDTWMNDADPSSNFMGIATSGTGSAITYAATNTSVPSLRTTHAYDIAYNAGQLVVKVDGVQYFNQTIALPAVIMPSFTAGTGGASDQHSVSNIVMTYEGGGVGGTSSTMPNGMVIGTSSLSGSTAITPGNWGNATQTLDTLKWTYNTGESLSAGTLVINGITHNPVLAGTYYAQLSTFSDNTCTTEIDNAVAAFAFTNNVQVQVQVDPLLVFSVAGYNAGTCNGATIDVAASTATAVSLGHVTASTSHIAGQTLSLTTNAPSGYTVYARYAGAMNDGAGHTIADWTGTNANPTSFPSPGTAAFAYTTDHALSSAGAGTTRFQANKWAAMTTSNAEIAYVATGYISDTTHVCYQATASTSTKAGAYTTTVIYIAVPTF
jgi:hypothetical protein